jgi:hypothetical protein
MKVSGLEKYYIKLFSNSAKIFAQTQRGIFFILVAFTGFAIPSFPFFFKLRVVLMKNTNSACDNTHTLFSS